MSLMQGDRVKYFGTKQFTDEKGLPLSLMGKVGEVVARVSNDQDRYVVEIEDESYLLHVSNLVKQPPLVTKGDHPIRRRRRDPDME